MPSTLFLRWPTKIGLLVITTAIVTAACSNDSDADLGPDLIGIPDTAGRIVVDSFVSNALGVSKRYLVYLPPSYDATRRRRYPVAYFLHGAFYDERSWVDDLRLDKVVDSIVAADSIEMIIVMPDGDLSFYHTWVNPPSYQSCLDRGRIGNEPAETYCVPNMRYDTYIANDLVKHIDEKYRTLADKNHRGVAGLSMGGAGAVYLMLAYPTVFGSAASMSAGVLSLLNIGTPENPVTATNMEQLRIFHDFFWIDFDMPEQFGTNLNDWRRYDPTSIAATVSLASFGSLWLIVGNDDNASRLGNQKLRSVLTQRGIPHTYLQAPGAHTEEFWYQHVGSAAGWLAKEIQP